MTASALSTLAILAVTAASSPFSLVAFSLVLATERGTRNGWPFIAGWVATVTLIGLAVDRLGASLDGDRASSSAPTARWVLIAELVIGVVLVLAGLRRRRRPPTPTAPGAVKAKPEPAWQRRIGTMGLVGAFALGGMVQTWPVMIAAAAELEQLDMSVATTTAWMVVFALATTSGLVVLQVLALRSPGSAAERLNRMRTYIDDHRATVINWVFVGCGVWLCVRALVGLL